MSWNTRCVYIIIIIVYAYHCLPQDLTLPYLPYLALKYHIIGYSTFRYLMLSFLSNILTGYVLDGLLSDSRNECLKMHVVQYNWVTCWPTTALFLQVVFQSGVILSILGVYMKDVAYNCHDGSKVDLKVWFFAMNHLNIYTLVINQRDRCMGYYNTIIMCV